MNIIKVDVDELTCFNCHMRGGLDTIKKDGDIYFKCNKCDHTESRSTILKGAVVNNEI